ncbi:hypothetical protein O6H91_Y518500 [Diphasiastrum complanatum]|nr:hypothetical protein O6H91_Y518500 [Diphasiastrum complanatum]
MREVLGSNPSLSIHIMFYPHHTSLETQAIFLTTSLHTAASLSFPSKPHRHPPTSSHPIQPPWFDAECRILHLQVTQARLHNTHLLPAACRSFHYALRRKTRTYETQKGKSLVDSLCSSSSGAFWRDFIPRTPPPPLTDLHTWTTYATTLYTTPTDTPISKTSPKTSNRE